MRSGLQRQRRHLHQGVQVRLPKGKKIEFTSGDYIQIEIPPYEEPYKTMEVAQEYREDWDKFDLWRYVGKNRATIERAYSMANYPAEGDDLVMLNAYRLPAPAHAGRAPGHRQSTSSTAKARRQGDDLRSLR
ncbi:MAG: hypothetical protein R3E96_16750 [Planctomycetota bacterium]